MDRQTYKRLIDILHDYKHIPNEIETKKKVLEIKLCNPNLNAKEGYKSFVALDNEVDYLVRKYKTLRHYFSTINDKDRQLLACLMNNKNIFAIEKILDMTNYMIVKKIEFYSEALSKQIDYRKIYGIEEEKSL